MTVLYFGPRRLVGAFALLLVLVLSACNNPQNTEEDKSAPAELQDFVPELNIEPLWTQKIGNGQGRESGLRPALYDNIFYAAARNGRITAYTADSGEILWEYRADTEISGAIGISAELLLFGDVQGALLALNRTDGSLRWQRTLGAEILAPPVADPQRVVVRTSDDRLLCLSALDGAQLWSYETRAPLLSLHGVSAPLLTEQTVFAGLDSGWIVGLELSSGEETLYLRVGDAQGSAPIERLVDIDADLLLDHQRLYAAAYQSQLVAIDLLRGRVQWVSEVSLLNPPVLGFGNLYLSSVEGELIALGQENGRERWRREMLSMRMPGPPAAVLDYLALGDFEGYIHIVSQVDGQLLARLRHGRNRISAPILVREDTIYVMGDKGKLSAYRISPL